MFRDILDLDNVCIITHRTPDGDTLGAAFAMNRLFERHGKRSAVVCSEEVPSRLAFISDGATVLEPGFEPDVYISVDTATRDLMGTKYCDTEVKYAIDHHGTNSLYAENTILETVSSTGELLFELMKETGEEPDKYIAEKLYAAISLDTGCFKYSNTTPRTHMIAAELLGFGIDASEINRKLFDTISINQLSLQGDVIKTLRRYCDGKITVATMTINTLKINCMSYNDSDAIVSLSRRIEGTIVGVTIKEKEPGDVHISLRSNTDFDVSEIAAQFGGGGHLRAAGCAINGTCAEAEEKIVQAIRNKMGI